ncbi:glycoside hydrolase family 31 protein [Actinopolyspora mortivallis]|uniref:glycoside hydrolase family 31 protein n=1 Tax=Actinopolyspora mortivallis TaxID=33906 RepID=UPI00036249C7|nr:glycoside hydrolase family 31 protein [Actinopolyspora mortivallis]
MLESREDGRVLEVRVRHEVIRIEPWGRDSLRVRVARHRVTDDVPGALLPPEPVVVDTETGPDGGRIVNGALAAEVELVPTDTGVVAVLTFRRGDTGEELLAEQRAHFWWPGPRLFLGQDGGYGRWEQRFHAYEDEKLFGLGQHPHGRLDQKGLVLDLVQRNGEVSIPFLVSSRGYGLLWNMPGTGRVELAENGTRWVADSARRIDYWVTAAETPAGILERYAEATGRPPLLPEWASGFWQSKLRYRDQRELLSVAREYGRRGLPLSVIVVDFFHWTHLGDWRFDPDEWPDPEGMIRELADMGVRLLVSVWPSVSPLSENFPTMRDNGMLVDTERGVPVHAPWHDKGFGTELPVAFHDPTNPEAREFVWERVKHNYYDKGVRAFWLDACEPELRPGHPHNLSFHTGPGAEVVNMYPLEQARAFHEGSRAAGDEQVVLLCRSAWAGSQRYGAALWSGDIPATWESLRAQVRAGLNTALSGIPWWTTDIGGFHGGDPDSAEYRELLVRWFQYGAFCPLFRLHGVREPRPPFGPDMTGGPNEVWSYGEQTLELITETLWLRERLRSYLGELMRVAHETGLPPMRPLFVDFPHDERAWRTADCFMFGPDLLVAPVLYPGRRVREVHLPEGAVWTEAWTGTEHTGGTVARVDAPLERIPVFLRDGAEVPVRG